MSVVSRALYVCRPYRPEHSGTARKCVDCGGTVTVHPGVYADRVRAARDVGAELEIVCDGCAHAVMDVPGLFSIVQMPSPAEIVAANTAGRQ